MWGLPAATYLTSIQESFLLVFVAISSVLQKLLAIEKMPVPKKLTNSVLVIESGIAMSMKDRNGTEMSDSNFYTKENGIRIRGKKNQGLS